MYKSIGATKLILVFMILLSMGCTEDIPDPLTEEDLLDIIGPKPANPKVISLNVAAGQEVADNTVITVTFSKKMGSAEVSVSGAAGTMSLDGETATWTPTGVMPPGSHTLNVTGTDTYGQVLEEFTPFNFMVVAPDKAPPMIVDHKCDPKNGATGVDPGDYPGKLTIVFSERMAEVTVVAIQPNLDFIEELSGDTLSVNLLAVSIPFGTKFKLTLAGKDPAGNKLATPEYSFETMKPVEREFMNETKKIDAGTYAAWSLFLLKGNELRGEISCLNQDINVWLLSPPAYEAFVAGKEFVPYWQASRERIVQFAFDFTAPELGWYYLVLDNKFSWFTSKTVTVDLKIIE